MTPAPSPESVKDVLRYLEWSGESYGLPPYCPMCKRLERFGQHEPHCRLAAALKDPSPSGQDDEVARLRDKVEQWRKLVHTSAEAAGLAVETAKASAQLAEASTARVRELEEALKPFAEAADRFYPDDADTMRPAVVQALHFRRARSVLARVSGGDDGR